MPLAVDTDIFGEAIIKIIADIKRTYRWLENFIRQSMQDIQDAYVNTQKDI